MLVPTAQKVFIQRNVLLSLKDVQLEFIWKSSDHKQEHAVYSEGFYPKKILNKIQMRKS